MENVKLTNYLQIGDIVWAKNRGSHPHPIVYLGEFEEQDERYRDCFKACILSTKDVFENKKMEEIHFCKNDRNNKLYEERVSKIKIVPRDINSQYLVTKCAFSKQDDWITYVDEDDIVGNLSAEGLKFVKQNLEKLVVETDKPIYDTNPSIFEYEEE